MKRRVLLAVVAVACKIGTCNPGTWVVVPQQDDMLPVLPRLVFCANAGSGSLGSGSLGRNLEEWEGNGELVAGLGDVCEES